MGVSVCAHEMGNARYLRSCVPLISWWPCRNFSTHAHFFHITSCCLIWSWSNFAVSQREREPCCHANMTRKQRRSDEMRLINSDSYNWIVEYFTVQMTSDEGDCHMFLKIDSTCCCSAHFLSFFLGSYPFSGTLVTLVIALIASDVDKFILWEGECNVPKWMYPAEGM